MKNDDLHNLLTALGVAAEASLAFYRAAVQAGASQDEAFLLTKAYLAASMQGGTSREADPDGA